MVEKCNLSPLHLLSPTEYGGNRWSTCFIINAHREGTQKEREREMLQNTEHKQEAHTHFYFSLFLHLRADLGKTKDIWTLDRHWTWTGTRKRKEKKRVAK